MPLNLPTDDAQHQLSPGTLYVVATPIGNRDDITLRALRVLGQVDLIAAEDTRHTGKLLEHHGVKGRFISYHEHNEAKRTPDLIKKLKAGLSIALVSNAGTPSVSDPGYRLVKEAVDNQIPISPIPGVSAVVTALSVAGMPTDAFVFMGFPAKKKTKRMQHLEALAKEQRTIIFYESPRRLLSFLKELITALGDRYAVLSREMTKRHEEFARGFLSEILNSLSDRPAIKGECTLLIMGCQEDQEVSLETVRTEILQALVEGDRRLADIAKTVAKKYRLPKTLVYDEALKLKGKA